MEQYTKICPICHRVIAYYAQQCPYCGALQSFGAQMPEHQRPRSYMTESLILSVASFICCTIWALPFSIAAYVKSKDADRLWSCGNYYEAHIAADRAKSNLHIGLWIAVIPIIIAVVVVIICVILGVGILGSL